MPQWMDNTGRWRASSAEGDSPIFADHRCAAVPAKIGTVPRDAALQQASSDQAADADTSRFLGGLAI